MSKLSTSISPTPSTWNTNNFCEWEGITCDNSNRVTSIILPSKSLAGTLPSDLNTLSQIKALDLQRNSFSGELPTLANLTLLEQVFLDSNNFTSIPSDFFLGLTNLQSFSISDNYLAPWSLPNYLAQSTNLQSFQANNAQITGSIPDFFGNFLNLQSVRLSYNDLTGALPATFVWLHANAFTGAIPDLSNCINIFDLQLRDNQLTGLVPGSLLSLPKLTNITLQNNMLQSPLPVFQTNVMSSNSFCLPTPGNCDPQVTALLEVAGALGLGGLSLNDNNLTGSIPKILASLPNLQLLDVSNNNLSGPIPEFPQKVRLLHENNLFLGQNIPSGSPPRRSKGSLVSAGWVIGIVISVLVFVGIVSYACYYKCYRVPTKLDSRDHNEIPISENGNLMISIQVLDQATNHFIKRMKSDATGTKGFQAEIGVLTKVRHRHLVALLGYCINGDERLLVYEYMIQGTLSQHLFEWRVIKIPPLSWKQRVSIALDVGRGVEYLHSLAQQRFIHRDLKSANILLDNDMRAKVADFGLVRIVLDGKYSVETRLAGTFGYLPPEYAGTGRVATKVDVYAFGVVLMELVTGRKALDETMSDEICHLATWFRRIPISKENIVNCIDQVLDIDDEATLESIFKVAELAGHCTALHMTRFTDLTWVMWLKRVGSSCRAMGPRSTGRRTNLSSPP
ncbi:hypothetical protein L1987_10598 [Smallanthus sonchifolius]|uniref:Uncharacterized protein n=1 Tax=Smallanthus sonchifolius TaxID=185202 RepID=A0ACB9JSN9_9ASTR|nr:hypothetical protein L1987_10598 [Smallanthus sonchifolius]